MKPSVVFQSLNTTTPVWFGSRMSDGKIAIPGGVRVPLTAQPQDAANNNKRILPSGAVLARTYAQKISAAAALAANDPNPNVTNSPGTGYVKLTSLAGDANLANYKDICINWFDHDLDNDGEIINAIAPKSGNVLYYNFLPEWATIAANATMLELLFDNFVCVYGQD